MKPFNVAKHPRKKHQGALGQGDNGGHFARVERQEINLDEATASGPPTVQVEFRSTADIVRRISAATPDELDVFARHENLEVRHEVAYSQNAHSETLRFLSHDKDWGVRSAVAENPKTPADVLRELKDDVSCVKSNVAANFNTPVDVLREMSGDIDFYVQNRIASNRNTDATTLLNMMTDSWHFDVRLAAHYNLSDKGFDVGETPVPDDEYDDYDHNH